MPKTIDLPLATESPVTEPLEILGHEEVSQSPSVSSLKRFSWSSLKTALSLTENNFPDPYDQVSLPAIRRRLRQVPDIFDYGDDTTTDWTSAFDAAVEDLYANGGSTLFFPFGSYYFGSRPATIPFSLQLLGESQQTSLLCQVPGTFIWFDGGARKSLPYGGGAVRNIGLYYDLTAYNISTISAANPAQVTTSTAHGFSNGDKVFILGINDSPASNYADLNTNTYYISNVTTDTFTLDGVDSSTWGSFPGGGTVRQQGNTLLLAGGASGSYKPDFFTVEDVALSGASGTQYDYAIVLDGSNNIGQGGGSLGIRNGSIRNVKTFNASSYALDIRQGRGWNIHGIDVNAGYAPISQIIVQYGSTSPTDFPSDDIKFTSIRCTNMVLDGAIECTGAAIRIFDTISMTANTNANAFQGYTAHFTNNGTNNSWNGSASSF